MTSTPLSRRSSPTNRKSAASSLVRGAAKSSGPSPLGMTRAAQAGGPTWAA